MGYSDALDVINSMSVVERIRLVQDILDGIADENDDLELTEDLKRELDRRLAAHDANPDDVVPWEKVKEELLARIKK